MRRKTTADGVAGIVLFLVRDCGNLPMQPRCAQNIGMPGCRKPEPGSAETIIPPEQLEESAMNGIIYIVGLVVVVGAVLSFLGLH
jgi:hypothetical protein